MQANCNLAIFVCTINYMDDKGFDSEGFYRALEATVIARGLAWKQVAAETGVSPSTLTRMAQGRKPDASSLAALSAWAVLNPADFVRIAHRPAQAETMAQISMLLRSDPKLDGQGADALEAIVKAAYERFRREDSGPTTS